MSLLDRFTGSNDPPKARFHCQDCGTDFESDDPSRSAAECPECGATGARHITRL